MANDGGPFVTFALLCERVLQEADRVPSLIRVVDQVTIQAQSLELPEGRVGPPQPVPVVSLMLALGFKSGDVKGSHEVTVRLTAPSGFKLPEVRIPAYFEGDDRGVNVFTNVALAAQEEGVYWFDVLVGEVRQTRIPLRVVKQTMTFSMPPQL